MSDARAIVLCSGCGRQYSISARREREIRQGGKGKPTCKDCRFGGKLVIEVTDLHRRWWRAQYTEAEIVNLAEDMFGPMSEWTPGWEGNIPGLQQPGDCEEDPSEDSAVADLDPEQEDARAGTDSLHRSDVGNSDRVVLGIGAV